MPARRQPHGDSDRRWFSVAMHATCIHVVDRGAILESGTHDDLLARGGKYAAGWQTLLAESRRH